ncbi:MAG: hypothetical protein CEE40_03120 [Chloroflexi bacterium B3_Chlor]|nr:MAG: hypothetical protein CEE40_03120 [Chloroflexi bacterium B3_Chlor]
MKTLTVAGLSLLLLALFFQCCPSSTTEGPAAPPPAEEIPTAPAEPPTATPPPMPTHTPLPIPTSTPEPPPPEPQRLTGHGQQASPLFPLLPGLAVFRMTHDGAHNFAITLLDNQGEWVELLVNMIGPFNGAKAVGVEQEGNYIMDISADGSWTVLVEQPRPPSDTPSPPQTFAGSGQQVSPFIMLSEGLARFQMTHDGAHNFAIVLLDSRGNWVDLLVNEIGPFDGSKAVGIRQSGAYLLDIAADGNWTLTIEQ